MTYNHLSWLSMTYVIFRDFPHLENGLTKLQDIPWPATPWHMQANVVPQLIRTLWLQRFQVYRQSVHRSHSHRPTLHDVTSPATEHHHSFDPYQIILLGDISVTSHRPTVHQVTSPATEHHHSFDQYQIILLGDISVTSHRPTVHEVTSPATEHHHSFDPYQIILLGDISVNN